MDVISRRLLNESSKAPDVLFVDSDHLLETQRLTKAPVAKLQREARAGDQAVKLSPVVFKTKDGARDEVIGSLLGAIEGSVDLMDPFARLEGLTSWQSATMRGLRELPYSASM